MKKTTLLFFMIIILLGGIYSLIRYDSLREINKYKIDVSTFIDCVDDISENKVQVNWKYVAAIVGVAESNKFDKVTELEIIEIAEMFIDSNKLNDLETVLGKLGFNKREKERTYKYIEDLKYYGIMQSKLQPDTKYSKFIDSIKEGAIENYERYKILPSITIAQAILETGWGESKLSSEYNNLFGIKADSSWNEEYVTLETTEFSGIIINDKFRKYNDKNQSIYDHGKFLSENKRYKENGVFESNTYKYQAYALQEAGYSTISDENGEKIYAKRLIQLIQQYNLQIIDSEVQN
ncbi:MAG: glycoside hydrolase family 73 protein [Peptostreptococcaceae bacterium]